MLSNCCKKHANCEVDSCVLVIDFLNPCCADVVACMSVLEAIVIGLYYRIDFTASMLPEELDQLIDCVVYA